MPKPTHPLRQPTAWLGVLTLALVLFFWFKKAATIPIWRHLIFGAVLGLVAVILANYWRQGMMALGTPEDEKNPAADDETPGS